MENSDNIANFDLLKIKIYTRTMFVAALVIVLVWGLSTYNGTLDRFESHLYTFFTSFCLVSLMVFKVQGLRFLRLFENIALGLVFFYFLLQYIVEIKAGLSAPALDFRKFLLWIAILYVFSFLMFPARQALQWSSLYLISISIIGIYYGFQKIGAAGLGDDILVLVQIFGSGVIYVSLLYAISMIKEKYIEAEIRSDMMSAIANTDMLTGAHSRVKIEEYLDIHISVQKKPLSVLLLDLDKLKDINDTYGHSAGDYVLKRTVELLRSNLRESDWLGRIGGDEFLLVCPSTDLAHAKNLAKRLERTISEAEFKNVGDLTISVGVSTSQPGDTSKMLIDRADIEMYSHKKRNTLAENE